MLNLYQPITYFQFGDLHLLFSQQVLRKQGCGLINTGNDALRIKFMLMKKGFSEIALVYKISSLLNL